MVECVEKNHLEVTHNNLSTSRFYVQVVISCTMLLGLCEFIQLSSTKYKQMLHEFMSPTLHGYLLILVELLVKMHLKVSATQNFFTSFLLTPVALAGCKVQWLRLADICTKSMFPDFSLQQMLHIIVTYSIVQQMMHKLVHLYLCDKHHNTPIGLSSKVFYSLRLGKNWSGD